MAKNSPHDQYFKAVFSDKEAVKDFINGIFPDNLRKNLHLDSLKLNSNSYVDDQLNESFADLIYRCDYDSQSIEITLLFEHKSAPEKYPHLQLLRYMVNAWETQLREEKQLLPIIPIIFYHGKKPWEKHNLFSYYKKVDESLQAFIPNFDYLLTDMATISKPQIDEVFHSDKLRATLFTMKNIFHENSLNNNLENILRLAQKIIDSKNGETFYAATLVYLVNSANLDIQTIIDISRKLSRKGGEIAMTTAEKLRKEGKKEGKKETLQQTAIKMIENGAEDDFIKKCTGLTQEEVDKLRKEQDSQ